ncbi:MFS transporter [Pelomonas sp. KK5]|uniref:MFS transporter n=1 Tax=Pelomonas sp. KK5 TaxID=1855730 RepID=UPI001301DBC7|nr:MFS transporter [Pelomonas sp. KK5]
MAQPTPDSQASWRVLLGCCLVALFGVTALYGSTFGLFLIPMTQDLGWTRAEIAFSMTLVTFIGPLSMPLVGWVIDNLPLRPLVLWGVLLQSANFAAFGLMDSHVAVYYLLCVALMFSATGASLLTLAKIVQQWFDASLGKSLGILFAATAIGAVIHPPWVGWVLAHQGWRTAFFAMGLISLLLGGVAALLLIRERSPGARRAAASTAKTAGPSMLGFLKDATWWSLAWWNMFFGFAIGALSIHFAALLQDRGLSLAQAASMLSVMGIGGFAGNLLAGWLIDRFPATWLARGFVLAPLGAVVLLYFGHGIAAAAVAALMFGLFSSGDHALGAFLARRYFPAEAYGRASATQLMATTLGSGVSPWLSGLVYDATHSYDASLMMAGAAFLLATMAAWRLPAVTADAEAAAAPAVAVAR